MTLLLSPDLIFCTFVTEGTGALTIEGPLPLHRNFPVSGLYACRCFNTTVLTEPEAKAEVGLYTATVDSGVTLARTTILDNGAGGTSPVNWGEGVKYVTGVLLAQSLVMRDSEGRGVLPLGAYVGGTAAANLLAIYAEGTFLPTFSYQTPGDLDVAFASRWGHYTRIGNRVFFTLRVQFTPSFTTASGNAIVGGLPFTPAASGTQRAVFAVNMETAVTWPRPDVVARVVGGSTGMTLRGQGSGQADTQFTHGHFVSGVEYALNINGSYWV